MPRYLRTEKDPTGGSLRIDAGVRTSDGRYYLVLRRLPPEYVKPPRFVIELSGDLLHYRGRDVLLYKAYAIQDFSDKELVWLVGLPTGEQAISFLNFNYPTISRRLGRKLYKLSDEELRPLVDGRKWKLVGGMR